MKIILVFCSTGTMMTIIDNFTFFLGSVRLPLRKWCMEGTRTAVLQEIGDEIKNVDGLNLIWRRGSSGVGKLALAASTAIWPEDQKRRVISFRFELQGRLTNRDSGQRRQITSDVQHDRGRLWWCTNALWRAMACDLARLYSYLWSHLAQGYQLGD